MGTTVDKRPTATPEDEAARLQAKGFPTPVVCTLLVLAFVGGAIKVGPLADLIEIAKTRQKAEADYFDARTNGEGAPLQTVNVTVTSIPAQSSGG